MRPWLARVRRLAQTRLRGSGRRRALCTAANDAPQSSAYVKSLVEQVQRRAKLMRSVAEKAKTKDDVAKAHMLVKEILTPLENEQVRAEFKGADLEELVFGTYIKACANAVQPRAADAAYKTMLAKSLKPSERIFGKLQVVHARKGNLKAMEQYFFESEQRGGRGSVESFSNIIRAHAVRGHVKRVEYWLQRMRAAGHHAPNSHYAHSLAVLCQMAAGRADDAKKTTDMMAAEGLDFNLNFYNQSLASCVKMCKAATPLVPSPRRWQWKRGLAAAAVQWAKRAIEQSNVTPNLETYSLVFSALDLAQNAGATSAEIEDVYSVLSQGQPPNSIHNWVHGHRVAACRGDVDAARRLVDQICAELGVSEPPFQVRQALARVEEKKERQKAELKEFENAQKEVEQEDDDAEMNR